MIMSSFGDALCRLPVLACVLVYAHVCIFAQSIYTLITTAESIVCVCVRVCTCMRVCENVCVNMSGCRRRPISWCISEEVSVHTPVCGPITPAHHTLTYRHTDSIAVLIIETY